MSFAPIEGDAGVQRVEWIPTDKLERMLLRERELRLSEKTQREYEIEEAKESMDGGPQVTIRLQETVVREFFPKASKEVWDLALYALRTAAHAYPSHPRIPHIPFQVKFNRMRKGNLRRRDIAPDVSLYRLVEDAGEKIELTSVHGELRRTPNTPLVIVGGSYS